MKKHFLVYGTAATLLVGYWGFLGYCYLSHNVTNASYADLEIGMTKRQVRSILGVWPDKSYHLIKCQTHEDWVGDEGTILLAFDETNRLVWKEWVRERTRPTLRERWEGLWWVVRE